ncbi:MAG: alcohol dehydrogenase catalytic domain-containing protein [Tissierellia bacterium]|nr:alcohol dehydrogenase catalytic domain-containing protein [Tissierellia bacterium]
MKRAVFYGNEVIEIEESPEPIVKARDVKVKIAYCAICGSEGNLFSKPLFTNHLPHPLIGKKGPFSLGHECSGIVTEIGKDVDRVSVGDKVAIQPIISCGTCDFCRKGLGNLCEEGYALLGSATDGGMSEYISLPEENVYSIPEDMTLENASLVQCGAVSFGAVMDSGIKMGDTALVIGAGTIGLMTAQGLEVAGARRILVADLFEPKLILAKTLGATDIINVKKEDLYTVVMDLTKGKGVDFVFECAGVEETVATALKCVRKQGTIMITSAFYNHVPLPGIPFLLSSATIKTTISPFVGRYDYMIELAYHRKMTPQTLITKYVDLDHTLEGFLALKNDPSQIKVMIEVDPSLEN